MLGGNSAFMSNYPVATKRVHRSYIRAAEHCAREPGEVADFLVTDGRWPTLTPDFAREMMSYLPYDVWRRYDPEDTVRFYALRLHEAGIIDNTPEEIIERATDWRFLEELKEDFAQRRGPAGPQFSFYCDPETGAGPRRLSAGLKSRETRS
jgi:NitT/TauT family transport system substrate-binding protein